MRPASLASLACLAALAAGPCLAQTPAAQPSGRPIYRLTTFNDLVRVCDTQSSDPEYDDAESLCAGYVAGVLDDHRLESAAGTAKTRLCMHEMSVTAATGREMLAWARENSRYAEEPAAQGVVRFFAAAHPCP